MTNFLQDGFKRHIERNLFFNTERKYLLACSGGIDSMSLSELLKISNIKFSIAHCNFKLRGQESDTDENFVANYSSENNIKFYSKSFDTEQYANAYKLSIQVAARELRYAWFIELINTEGYEAVLTAHNLDDQIETFFINLSRGTGIRGLTGIPEKSNRIIRPLLFASRDEIVHFAKNLNIKYREDSSNANTKYLRNKMRHEILPIFKNLNPSFSKTMHANLNRIEDVSFVYFQDYQEFKQGILKEKNDAISIDKSLILSKKLNRIFFKELLSEYKFNQSQIEDIFSLLNESGKVFYSEKIKLLIDRESLIFQSFIENDLKEYPITEFDTEVFNPVNIQITKFSRSPEWKIPVDSNTACLDFEKLKFPLKLRKWKQGDKFIPLGMNSHKKLSDFFIDEKLSVFEKGRVWVLESDDKIIWIVGYRIDDRYKITKSTNNIIRFYNLG